MAFTKDTTPEIRESIIAEYAVGNKSYNQLGRKYHKSSSYISMVIPQHIKDEVWYIRKKKRYFDIVKVHERYVGGELLSKIALEMSIDYPVMVEELSLYFNAVKQDFAQARNASGVANTEPDFMKYAQVILTEPDYFKLLPEWIMLGQEPVNRKSLEDYCGKMKMFFEN